MNSPPPSPTSTTTTTTSTAQNPKHSTLLLTTLESTLTATLSQTTRLDHLTQQLLALQETLQSLGGLHLLAQTARNKYLENLRRSAGLPYSRLLTNLGGLDGEFNGRSVGGDAVADALLYRDGVRHDWEFFAGVYGVGWGWVLEVRHDTELIRAVSHRADVFSRGQGFTAEFEVMFRKLIIARGGGGGKAVDNNNGNGNDRGVRAAVSDDNEALSWFTQIMSS